MATFFFALAGTKMCILYHRARKHVNEHEQALNQTENRIGQQFTEQANTKLSREHERAKEREKRCKSNDMNANQMQKLREIFTNIECSKGRGSEREREKRFGPKTADMKINNYTKKRSVVVLSI